METTMSDNMSKKIRWYKQMIDKIAYEEKLWDAACKMADGQQPNIKLPKDKGGCHKPKNLLLFQGMIEDAKWERQKRLDKKRKEKDNNDAK